MQIVTNVCEENRRNRAVILTLRCQLTVGYTRRRKDAFDYLLLPLERFSEMYLSNVLVT